MGEMKRERGPVSRLHCPLFSLFSAFYSRSPYTRSVLRLVIYLSKTIQNMSPPLPVRSSPSPYQGDFFELPATERTTAELAYHRVASSYRNTSEGDDVRQGNNPCPNSALVTIRSQSILRTRA